MLMQPWVLGFNSGVSRVILAERQTFVMQDFGIGLI
jgi:hypothetical protein